MTQLYILPGKKIGSKIVSPMNNRISNVSHKGKIGNFCRLYIDCQISF